MSIKGNVESNALRGRISSPEVIHGLSAYEIAVMNGFDGTVEEWLESLLTDEDKNYIAQVVLEALKSETVPKARLGEVELSAAKWVGDDSPYSQVVEIEGITENSQVDLTPSVEQLAIFHEKDIAFVTENEGGVVTVYVVGQKPENDYTIQVTITEVGV